MTAICISRNKTCSLGGENQENSNVDTYVSTLKYIMYIGSCQLPFIINDCQLNQCHCYYQKLFTKSIEPHCGCLFVNFAQVALHAIMFVLFGVITFYPLTFAICNQIRLILASVLKQMRLDVWTDLKTYSECFDLMQAMLLKLTLKELRIDVYITNRYIDGKKIMELLSELQETYDYFADDDIEHPYLFYAANDIVWIEFLAGKLSNLSKTLINHSIENDKNSNSDNPGIHIIATDIISHLTCKNTFEVRDIPKYHHLEVVSLEKHLFLRFKLVFDQCAVRGRKFRTLYNSTVGSKGKAALDSVMSKLGFNVSGHTSRNRDSICDQHLYYFLKNLREKVFCNHVCCRKRGQKLKACRKCKSAWYCSKKCQKRDWKMRHRDSCLILSK